MTPDQLTQFHAAVILLCKHFKVTTDQLEGPSKSAGGAYHRKDGKKRWGDKRPNLVLPRQMLMFFCRHIGIRTKHISALMNRCSSDISHSCRAFKNRLDTERNVREVWEWLESSI